MTKPTAAASAAGLLGSSLPSRQIAIGKALQDLEPAVLDLARMSHLVSEHTEGAIGTIRGEYISMLAADADTLLFGVYDLDNRIRALKEGFEQAFHRESAS